MKNIQSIIASLILFATLFSCKTDELAESDSYIFFDKPQPVDVAAIIRFPENFVGIFSLDYLHSLIVQPNRIIKKFVNHHESSLKQLDSLPEFEFKNKIVFERETNLPCKTTFKNDIVYWETETLDTIFSFDTNETAKIYKSDIILSKEFYGSYVVNILKFALTSNKYTQLGTRKDFEKINQQLKIPFHANVKNNDTTYVILSPSRADFRKLLRMDGFEYDKFYYLK